MVSNSQIADFVKISMTKQSILNPRVDIIGHLESEGYISNTIFVKASGMTVDAESKTYELIVKFVKNIFWHNNAVQRICKSEHHVYKNVLPVLNAILEERGLSESIAAPKCYGCYDVQNGIVTIHVVVLEHLGQSGFEVLDKTRVLPLDHLKLLLKEHAKIHALSVALRTQRPELYKKLVLRNGEVLNMACDNNDVVGAINEGARLAIASLKGNDDELYEKTCRLIQKPPAVIYMELLDLGGADEKAVLNHGDCWNDNYLFNYKDDGKTLLSEAKIVDFQAVQLNSPVCDISNMIYSVSSCDLDHFGDLLRSYHDSLTHYLSKLGCDPNFFTFEDLKAHWKKYALRGLVVALYTIRVIIAVKPEEADDKGFLEVTLEEGREDLFRHRVRSMMLHYFASMEIIDTV